MTPATVRDLLRRIEWEGDDTLYTCPCCRRDRAHGHARDCELKRILDVSASLSSILGIEKVATA